MPDAEWHDTTAFSALLETLPEKDTDQKRLGVYATSADVADYLARNTILPFLLSAIDRAYPDASGELRRLLQADPDRYLHEAVRRGTDTSLPAEIAAGLSDLSVRAAWNQPVPTAFGPLSETWRTHLARRQRCHDLRQRLRGGALHGVADLIACNLNLARLVNDLLDRTTDPRLPLIFWNALRTLSVLDPTCGTGAFLFAALRTLEPLYLACLRRRGPPSRFHVLSSIVWNNLHGIDLMPEAVEICRLRLRLELASTATSRKELSLLSDSADNLHVGNLLLKLPDVLPRDGFDVVLGNPPYLEMREVDYVPHGYACASTGAVHALCVERSLQLLQPNGYLGMVLPLAVASTQRMRCVQRLLEDNRYAWYAHFSWRPAKLFPAVNRAMTTVISTRAAKSRTWSTAYQKWRTSKRDSLMERIAYVEVPHERRSFWVPKLGTQIECGLLAKLLGVSTVVGDFLARPSAEEQVGHIYYRTDGGLYWKVFTDFPPAFTVGGRAGHSTREARLAVADPVAVVPLIAALSSNVFWWWYTVTSNCRHLNPTDVQQFPLPSSVLAEPRLVALGRRYLRDIVRHSRMAVRRQRQTGHTETQAFKVRRSRGIVEQIDGELARHYSLTAEELDFVVNYDIEFRMGTRLGPGRSRPDGA